MAKQARPEPLSRVSFTGKTAIKRSFSNDTRHAARNDKVFDKDFQGEFTSPSWVIKAIYYNAKRAFNGKSNALFYEHGINLICSWSCHLLLQPVSCFCFRDRSCSPVQALPGSDPWNDRHTEHRQRLHRPQNCSPLPSLLHRRR